MTCHITLPKLPFHESPPLTPETLTLAQRNFLALHLLPVERWQWHFCDTQLRAHVGRRSATIWKDELEHLIVLGLMSRELGVSVSITTQGREVAEAKETAI